MTIDEAKKLLPSQLKYPLPDEVIDNLINVLAIPLKWDFGDDEELNNNKDMDYALMAALIELKEIREDDYRSGIAKAIYDKGYKSGWNSCISDETDGWTVDYIKEHSKDGKY